MRASCPSFADTALFALLINCYISVLCNFLSWQSCGNWPESYLPRHIPKARLIFLSVISQLSKALRHDPADEGPRHHEILPEKEFAFFFPLLEVEVTCFSSPPPSWFLSSQVTELPFPSSLFFLLLGPDLVTCVILVSDHSGCHLGECIRLGPTFCFSQPPRLAPRWS